MPNSTLREVTDQEKELTVSSEPQPDLTKLKALIFEPGDKEAHVMVRVLDIPYIHCPSREESLNFCPAMATSFDPELFSLTCVTSIIRYRWNITYGFMFWRLFVPYVVYLMLFVSYVHLQAKVNTELGENIRALLK